MRHSIWTMSAALVACFALQCAITARQETFTFEKDKPGKAPSDWIADVTGIVQNRRGQ